MNNFREWLSDNLRYILLGIAGVVVLIVLFVGIRALSGSGGNKEAASSNQNQSQSQASVASGNEQSSANQVTESAAVLEKNAVPKVTKLVKSYYKALGDKDIDGLQKVVDNLDPVEEAKVANAEYIESYENVEVYTAKGLEEGSYVVFASFSYKCKDVDTPAPALSQLYVTTNDDGELWISADAVNDPEIQQYVSSLMNEAEVVELRNNVQAAYDQAQADDPQLKEFLESLGNADAGTPTPAVAEEEEAEPDSTTEWQTTYSEAETPTEDAGEGMMVALDDCNVRAAAKSGTNIITVVPAGEQVTRLGEENGWIQIEYNGVVGYVYHDLLQ